MARIFDFFRWGGAGRDDSEAVRDLALTEIKRTWSVDEADVTPTEFGFDWLPGSHLVRVRIHEDERKSDGPKRFRISIRTDCLNSVPVHDMGFILKVSMAARSLAPTYALVYPPGEVVKKYFKAHPADMEMYSSAYVYDDTVKWTSGFLARMSIMQPINAEFLSRSEGTFINGTPALANGSLRLRVNGVLNIHADLLIPEGQKTSRWLGSSEFGTFLEQYGQSDACFGFDNENGMSFETPFGADSALIQFNADEADSRLGNGLVVRTRMPGPAGILHISKLAAELNYLEAVQWTDFPQLGCWQPLATSEETSELTHVIFVPNAYFNEGLVVNLALWAITRVRWVRNALYPNAADLTMIEILEKRFGPLRAK
jgi:hypothetical protein